MANPLYDRLFGCHAGRAATFLHLPDGGRMSFDAFLRLAARSAHALRTAGLSPGDRLALQVEKSAEALAIYAACVQAGVILLPLNTGYTIDEVEYFVGDSGASLLLCDPGQEPALRPVAGRAGAELMTLGAAGTGTFPEAAAEQPEPRCSIPPAPPGAPRGR